MVNIATVTEPTIEIKWASMIVSSFVKRDSFEGTSFLLLKALSNGEICPLRNTTTGVAEIWLVRIHSTGVTSWNRKKLLCSLWNFINLLGVILILNRRQIHWVLRMLQELQVLTLLSLWDNKITRLIYLQINGLHLKV